MNSKMIARPKIFSGLFFALALAASSAATAGDETGKMSGTVKFSSKAQSGGVNITDGTAIVTWTLVEELPDVRTYTASGTMTGNLTPAFEEQGMNCAPVPVQGDISGSGKLVVYTERANFNPSTYGFAVHLANPDPALTTECSVQGGGTIPITFPNVLLLAVGGNCLPDTTLRPVPFTDPEVLQGTFDCPSNEYFPSLSAEWTFRGKIEDVILEVTPAGGYKKWRPSANEDGGDGEPVEFTATLKTKDGGVPEQRIKELQWELIETSAEHGFTINWPQQPSNNDPDLYFKDLPATTPGAVRKPVGKTGQKVIVTFSDDGELSDSISIHPRDWGGWSTLHVTAVLNDDRRVSGRLVGASEDGVRLPDRSPERFIARAWLNDRGITANDLSDLDDHPAGDSNKGDGLTLYEEYRGFHVDGKRVEGDPERKELFVVNEGEGPFSLGSAAGTAGIAHFQRITGLHVHGKLSRNEMDPKRVVNHNFSASPRLGPQHAVLIKVVPGLVGQANAFTADDRPKTPAGVKYIGLPQSFPWRATTSPSVSYATITVAHELLHAVNVYHHGESDRVVFWSRDPGGKLYEQKTEEQKGKHVPVGPQSEIRVFLDSSPSQDVTNQTRVGLRNLGKQHGQHSGVEDCVMRYDIADAYESTSDPNQRFVGIKEIQGAQLDNSADGRDVNLLTRLPQSRYGNAAPDRGMCQGQILVSDMVPPKQR